MSAREQFRTKVFERDGHRCVLCAAPAVDAHHIIERRLWDDGGYHLDNGASVCSGCHWRCENTTVSVEEVRAAAGITTKLLPAHLYADEVYDKWANIVLANGQRLRGELFFDESVQKALVDGGVLHLFTNRVKFPRTFHLLWSPGMHDDDRMMSSIAKFVGQRVVVTEKMDGENTTMYADYIHARSIDGRNHPSRAWVKNLWGRISYDIPPDWRICVENLYARHSLAYHDLASYAYGFAVWNERNVCLAWDETVEWLELLGIQPVPVLYDGIFDEGLVRGLYDEKHDWHAREGYVLRLADAFAYGQYRHCVGKFVRRNHVQTTQHWMHGQPIIPNELRK